MRGRGPVGRAEGAGSILAGPARLGEMPLRQAIKNRILLQDPVFIEGRGHAWGVSSSLLVIGEGDVELQYRQLVTLLIELDGDLVRIDLHILADHVEEILLELGQVIRPPS